MHQIPGEASDKNFLYCFMSTGGDGSMLCSVHQPLGRVIPRQKRNLFSAGIFGFKFKPGGLESTKSYN